MTFTECQNKKCLKPGGISLSERGGNMDFKMIAEALKDINKAGAGFLAWLDKEQPGDIRPETDFAEENLRQEILCELKEHIRYIRLLTEYMRKDIVKTGIVDRNEAGEITIDGIVLPLMTELEVLVYDCDLGRDVWTRVFVGGSRRRYLVGLDRKCNVRGIPGRIRE